MDFVRLAAALMAATSAVLLAPAPAPAATLAPDTTGDQFGAGAECSLREAVQAANTDAAFGGCPAGSGADEIELARDAYTLTIPGTGDDANASGDLDFLVSGGPTTLTAGGVEPTAIYGGEDRVINVLGGASLTVLGLSIQSGEALGGTDPMGDSAGGGILNDGDLVLTNSAVIGNVASYAGGIQNFGTATLTNVTISDNRANVDSGGYDDFFDGASTLTNVTVTNNVAAVSGAGNGGGIGHYGTGTLTISNSIVAGNSDMSAGPTAGADDCYGPIRSAGHNLIGSTEACEYVGASGDLIGAFPNFGSRVNNGGPTETYAPLAPSAAIDAGSPATPGAGGGACAADDQRGVPRPAGGACDIGAYELAECRGATVDRVGTPGPDELLYTGRTGGFLLLGGADLATGAATDDSMCGGSGRDSLKARRATTRSAAAAAGTA